MMPQLSEPGGRRDRRIDGDDDAHQLGAREHAALLDLAALPQAGHALLHDLAFQLLAADGGVAVAALHLGQERGRQEPRVVGRARAGDGGGEVVQDLLQEEDRPRAWW